MAAEAAMSTPKCVKQHSPRNQSNALKTDDVPAAGHRGERDEHFTRCHIPGSIYHLKASVDVVVLLRPCAFYELRSCLLLIIL